ncbi:MAG: YkvA family protein [Thermoanaerobaculia bacterium]
MSEQDFEETMRESAEVTGPVSRERANRFYDRMRESIRRYLDKKGSVAGTTGEYLLLAPDVFVLLWRLVNDGRVSSKNKVMLGSGLAYFLFPLDIMPEAFLGPVGYLDDLVFGVYLLNKMLTDTDVAILRQHWSGRDDVLATIRNVLNAADNLVGKDILGKLKKNVK